MAHDLVSGFPCPQPGLLTVPSTQGRRQLEGCGSEVAPAQADLRMPTIAMPALIRTARQEGLCTQVPGDARGCRQEAKGLVSRAPQHRPQHSRSREPGRGRQQEAPAVGGPSWGRAGAELRPPGASTRSLDPRGCWKPKGPACMCTWGAVLGTEPGVALPELHPQPFLILF